MKLRIKEFLLSSVLLCAPVLTGHAQVPAPAATPAPTAKTVQNFVPVTDAMLRAPKPEDWLLYRGNYQGWGYSPLDRINKQNVKNLQLVWSRAMGPGENEATPIVYNGIMYLGNPRDVIQAIDAATGDLIWEYEHKLPARETLRNNQGQKKRGISLYGNYVIFVTWDNVVVGLDARTGKLAWQGNRGGGGFVTNSSGPIVANGMVIAGSTCNTTGGCYVTGHDARNGEELWRNEMIPRPGQPGDETWGGAPFESRWHTGQHARILARGAPLPVFDTSPVADHVSGARHLDIREDVRVSPHELVGDRAGDVGHGELTRFGSHLSVKDHLQQQIAQFVAHLAGVAALDGLEHFVGFLQQVGSQAPWCLLAIPWTPARRA